jgi:hypothetical protein
MLRYRNPDDYMVERFADCVIPPKKGEFLDIMFSGYKASSFGQFFRIERPWLMPAPGNRLPIPDKQFLKKQIGAILYIDKMRQMHFYYFDTHYRFDEFWNRIK